MQPRSTRARYDADGNIILPSGDLHAAQPEPATPAPITRIAEPESVVFDALQWGVPEEPAEDLAHLPSVLRETTAVRASCHAALARGRDEAIAQVLSGFDDATFASHGVWEELKLSLRQLRAFLTQPVLVPSRKHRVKQYGRGTLFALDMVRFGGTFAAIFALLFSAMNYESFIAIAAARIEPILAFTNLDTSASVERSLAEKLRQVPSLPTAGEGNGGLTAYLPPVGPPEDLLIIPKLNLRVPIVAPPTDALLTEDWKLLEEQIQTSLESGVVHYPGTAEPGQGGNFFVTGHSSYFPWAKGDYKSVFARLGGLDIGDEFWVYHGGDKYLYRIETKKEILPSDVTVLDQPVNKRIATLMTCTPVGTTLRRLIIIAQEVDPLTGEAMEVGEHQKHERPAINVEALPI